MGKANERGNAHVSFLELGAHRQYLCRESSRQLQVRRTPVRNILRIELRHLELPLKDGKGPCPRYYQHRWLWINLDLTLAVIGAISAPAVLEVSILSGFFCRPACKRDWFVMTLLVGMMI